MVVELIKFLWVLKPFWPEVPIVELSNSGLGADFWAGGGERVGKSKDFVFSSKNSLLR